MKLDKKIIEEITDILDNVTYWETCPEEYKQKIPVLIRALNMHYKVSRSIGLDTKDIIMDVDKDDRNDGDITCDRCKYKDSCGMTRYRKCIVELKDYQYYG